MPSYVAVGSEFTVNSVLTFTQQKVDMARLADGRFVAVWESSDVQHDPSSGGIKGRVMTAGGVPIGPEFLVNTATADAQTYPSVAGLAGGGFVVTWTTRDPTKDGSYDSIRAQLFNDDGQKVGVEFQVNTATSNIQWISSTAALDNGGFVITWETYDSSQDGSSRAIKAQIFDASGAKSGGEFLVNTITADHQMGAEISALSGGRFIVIWSTQIFGQTDVRAQVFDSTGAKLGGEIFVNTATASSQTETNVTNLANGGFVITWTTMDTAQDGNGYAIKAQVFDAAGAKVGGELLVNTAAAANQRAPTVAGLENGDFVIVWRTDDQTADDMSGALKAQVFDSTGNRLGTEFRVNTRGSSIENDPMVIDLGNGAFAVGWSSSTASNQDIRAQIFSSGSAPVITSDGGGATASLTMAENSLAVTTVHANDLDSASLTYSIAGGADAALFTIDPTTGALAFLAAPDFQAPADADGDNLYEVVVRASDGERSDQQAISVQVEAANQAVTITSDGGGDSAALAISEGATQVTTVTAVDGDGDPIDYSIVGGADAALFTIDAVTGALAFAAAPDREDPADANGDGVYEVVVRASDGALADSQALSISVGDVNEAPVLTFYGYPISGDTIVSSVPEGHTSYALFGAADPEGDPLDWSLSGDDAALFSYDPVTGWLSFNAAPNYEAPGSSQGTNTYRVTLTASDGALTDAAVITIHIRNVNEALAIVSLGGGDTALVTVDENQVAVADVVASDLDGDAPVYAIAGGADAAHFVIDADTGALEFAAAPDFETPADADGDGYYEVLVTATDGHFTDSQLIAVAVADVAEPPAFAEPSLALSLDENAGFAGTLEATGVSGPIAYAVAGGADAGRFVVDPLTGALSFAEAPDFEQPADGDGDNVYEVIVSATDAGGSALQTVSVSVGNVDEGVEIVSHDGAEAVSLDVAENGLAVATVAAIDADGGPVSYAIAGGADAGLFTVDAETGALSFTAAPDFELPADADGDNVYEVVVEASDGQFTDSQTFAVTIVNQAEPVRFAEPTLALSVDENGSLAGTLLATGESGPVAYAIAGGADADRFVIDALTGTLSFADAPDFEQAADADGDNVYEILVSATDDLGSALQSVSVAVGNVDEGVDITSYGGDDTVFLGLAENGLAAATVAAIDADGDAVTYQIVGGADAALFAIDAETGALSFLAGPDFEAPADADADNVYKVEVAAVAGAFADVQSFAIEVGNVNEGIAITSNGGGASGTASVNENSVHVTTVAASDPDGTEIVYSIVGGADAARFTIDGQTGVLRFVTAPNFESPGDADDDNVYDLVVAASDGEVADVQALAVSVTNVRDGNIIIGTGGSDQITPSSNPLSRRTSNEEDTVEGAGGNDTIDGGAGDDILNGGVGADQLRGGTGADQFVYTSTSHSTSSSRDLIQDFSRAQGDKISLSAIDASTAASGNQAFSFIGAAAFTGTAGELRYENSGGSTYILGDVNGDGLADLSIRLQATIPLLATDFVL